MLNGYQAPTLELAPIGWHLFALDRSPNDQAASLPPIVAFATRLLVRPLSLLLREAPAFLLRRRVPGRCVDSRRYCSGSACGELVHYPNRRITCCGPGRSKT